MTTNKPAPDTVRWTGALQAPLDSILGTVSGVRLLRELSGRQWPVSPSELAECTGLDRAGVYRSLDSLFDTGILEFMGGRRGRLVSLRDAHPLTTLLRSLYRGEAERYGRLIDELRAEVESLHPPVRSAWIQGPAARGQDRFGDPLVLAIWSDPDCLNVQVEVLRDRLAGLESEHDFTLETRGYTGADLLHLSDKERVEIEGSLHLHGMPVRSLLSRWEGTGRISVPPTHIDHDTEALRHAEHIADLIRSDPELIERAHAWVRSRMQGAGPSEVERLREWDRLLQSASPARLSQFLRDPGERATHLRQSNPFLQVLTAVEREKLRRERARSS